MPENTNDIEAAVQRIMQGVDDFALYYTEQLRQNIMANIRAELGRVPAKCPRHGVYMCVACMKGAVPAEPTQQVEVPAIEPVTDEPDYKTMYLQLTAQTCRAEDRAEAAEEALELVSRPVTDEEVYAALDTYSSDNYMGKSGIRAALESFLASRAKGVKS